MTLITGNTYPIKQQLKALGGRWNAAAKGWNVPDAVADQARALVGGAPESSGRGRFDCPDCGAKNALSAYQVARHYHCDACTRAEEGPAYDANCYSYAQDGDGGDW